MQYVTLATQCSQPNQSKQMELLKPTSDQITAIQDFREKNRASQYFNHLSAISESIPALGWVCVVSCFSWKYYLKFKELNSNYNF